MPVHREVGVEDQQLVAGIQDAGDRQQECARGAGGDKDLAIVVVKLGVDGCLQPVRSSGIPCVTV